MRAVSRARIAEVLARHAKSYNTDRPEARYAVCRCGLELRLDGVNTADDARTFAAHQALVLAGALWADE